MATPIALATLISDIETQLDTETNAKIATVIGDAKDHPMNHYVVSLPPPWDTENLVEGRQRTPTQCETTITVVATYQLAAVGADLKTSRTTAIGWFDDLREKLTGRNSWSRSRRALFVKQRISKVGGFLRWDGTFRFTHGVSLGATS